MVHNEDERSFEAGRQHAADVGDVIECRVLDEADSTGFTQRARNDLST
jgi:hypothetical protein